MSNNAHIFTPNHPSLPGERLKMRLSAKDHAKIGRGEGWKALVVDQNTGIIWIAKPAPCGAGCHCAADVEYIGHEKQEYME